MFYINYYFLIVKLFIRLYKIVIWNNASIYGSILWEIFHVNVCTYVLKYIRFLIKYQSFFFLSKNIKLIISLLMKFNS